MSGFGPPDDRPENCSHDAPAHHRVQEGSGCSAAALGGEMLRQCAPPDPKSQRHPALLQRLTKRRRTLLCGERLFGKHSQ